MPKHLHEIRDPIHVFIRLNTDERKVVDSLPVQRLRHIHQLATTFLVYPGATHRRFEHSLGVMELAARVFDVVTHPYNIHDDIRRIVPEITDQSRLGYWRSCLKMAALCHDIGHLPFSHAAEKELLPDGWDHERITRELLASQEMCNLFNSMTPPLRPEDVIKLAVGPKKAKDLSFSAWETVLAEIIVGDAFGVDRMDYLLRDSQHAGVVYGRFDHHRLIDTLRILPSPPLPATQQAAGDAPGQTHAPPVVHHQPSPREPALGIEEGGLHTAEALMLARFFMYSQLYFHPVRRAYDIHLKDFLKEWLKNGHFSTELTRHLELTDNEVTAALLDPSRTPGSQGHDAACRLTKRNHFRVLYQRHPDDVRINPEAGKAVLHAACQKFGAERCRHDRYSQRSGAPDFPVLTKDGRIASSLAMSQTLTQLESVSIDFVFVDPEILAEAKTWLQANCSRSSLQRRIQTMNRLQIAALLTYLVRRLRDNGSWCGETHVQKAAYIAQQLAGVPLGFDFILYKHGPFSFDLRDELTSLRADALLVLEPQSFPYGPKFKTTGIAQQLQQRFPKTVEKYKNALEFVATTLANKQVDDLERLATALFAKANFPDKDDHERAAWINQKKPHVSVEEALAALAEVDKLKEEFTREHV